MKKTMSILVLAVVVSGCGGESSDSMVSTKETDNGLVTELEGQWLKSCGSVDQNDNETLYDIVELTFTNNKISSSIRNFTDSNCSQPYQDSPNPKSSSYFQTGDKVIVPGGLESTEIDSQINRSEGAPFIANEFDIYYISDNVLYFGDSNGVNDGSIAARRPVELNYNRRYDRQ